MNWSSLRYLSRQGLHNLSKNRLMTLAGIGVLTACLVITGAATLFTANVNSLVDYLGSQNETVVYMDPTADDATVTAAYDSIMAVNGVASATFISKEDVLDTYRGYMEEYASLWDEFESDNPFKANYRVVVSDLDNIQTISDQLKQIPGVVNVRAPIEMTSIFVKVQHVVMTAGYILVAVLAIVSLVVISNTIRLSVYARRKEINIMKYVGATDSFIRWPFFVEGVGVGLIASALACGIVLGAYWGLTRASGSMTGFWQTLLGDSVVPLSAVWYWIVPAFLLGGCAIGGIGSVMSVRKHLDV
ncbi:MAG: permease-like cell division protein FtsX [Faecalibacterium sp.]|jgi:cell division transport system permease protein|nr:permease-like cell division protein FtsX [Faecalibacterium sp.]